jgi:hypothetical protein
LFSLGSFWKITEVAKIFGCLFSTEKLCINFDTKMRWVLFWVILSQTYLVALLALAQNFKAGLLCFSPVFRSSAFFFIRL